MQPRSTQSPSNSLEDGNGKQYIFLTSFNEPSRGAFTFTAVAEAVASRGKIFSRCLLNDSLHRELQVQLPPLSLYEVLLPPYLLLVSQTKCCYSHQLKEVCSDHLKPDTPS